MSSDSPVPCLSHANMENSHQMMVMIMTITMMTEEYAFTVYEQEITNEIQTHKRNKDRDKPSRCYNQWRLYEINVEDTTTS